ncbi:hypothetical protein NPIL_461071 [Nephila pilipes]|uniref:Uncharacterized protein n=1 Tax=Nephila pilipes TaxID=299642 RepID=A0A8X6PUY2_NEPPI|nr:hypothetical protein NPIL_461071 [Nephila pilipes]
MHQPRLHDGSLVTYRLEPTTQRKTPAGSPLPLPVSYRVDKYSSGIGKIKWHVEKFKHSKWSYDCCFECFLPTPEFDGKHLPCPEMKKYFPPLEPADNRECEEPDSDYGTVTPFSFSQSPYGHHCF